MRITIEIDSQSEIDRLAALFETFDTLKVISSDKKVMTVTKGDKKIDHKALFGIWADKPRNIEAMRKAAWQRDAHVSL